MSVSQPKKLAIIYILLVLERFTSASERITQQRIAELVEQEYGMVLDRKTIRHNLSKLLEAGFPLEYDELERAGKNGTTELIHTNWYYSPEVRFDESELQVMIDSLLFSNYLPAKQCKDLINKVVSFGSPEFVKKHSSAYSAVVERPANKSLFYVISVLCEAISAGVQVSFDYFDYDTDIKPHPRLDDNGKVKLYVISPYKLVSLNGRYYLLCSSADHDKLLSFRVDRIKNISLQERKAKSVRLLKGYKNGINLSDYISEHPNMWGGEVSVCVFRCPRYIMNDIVDWFGSKAGITKVDDDTIEVRVRISEKAMRHWALQYSDCVEVLFPESLRNDIANTLREAAKRYGEETK